MRSKRWYAAASVVVVLVGCGLVSKGDEDKKNDDTPGPQNDGDGAPGYTLMLNTLAELPPCTTERQSQLVYVIESANFQVCKDGAWTVADIKGEKGDKGDKGDGGTGGAGGKNFGVYDAANTLLGVLIGTGYSDYMILTADGIMLNLEIIDEKISSNGCYYTSADCTGTCIVSGNGDMGEGSDAKTYIADLTKHVDGSDLNSQYRNNACTTNPGGYGGFEGKEFTPPTVVFPLTIKAL